MMQISHSTITSPRVREATPSSWVDSSAKRVLDLVLASLLVVLTSPVMILAGMAVKLTSSGSLFYRQQRCGKDGQPFYVMKLRSMRHSQGAGLTLTAENDPRVTPVGRVLRRWKLDELPQLLNVLRGEMNLVGPRPELPEYLACLSPEQQRVMRLKPGITSDATLHFRHEESLLANVPAAARADYYVESVLPQKVSMELEYASRASAFNDAGVLIRTILAIFR
jgi:lipopolysaccharide/colanic/teichoic acid biosynthesis glycosyltransferase